MAYEVTATRKRPRKFEEMVGQDFFVTTLTASLSSGKIAHAYLFSGPRGVGKTSAARILAKSLNCESGPTASPCGVCSNCREITQGNSLDVIEIDGASNTSVNDVREIKDEVLFAPNSSRYKIYIIDEVHMLSNSAFNALLKTIEEPPPYVIFIFATTAVHKVPATIRSRCQQFVFRLIPLEAIKKRLEEAAKESGVAAEDAAPFWIAKEATGSLRDAYTLFDQVSSFSEGNITFALIREKLGSIGLDSINEIVELLIEGKVKEALSGADATLQRGVSVEQFAIELADYFRCLLFLKHGIERESLLGFSVERFSKRVLEALQAVQLEKALEMIFQLYRDLRYSLNQRFELELMLSRLSTLTAYASPKELLQKIAELRAEIAGAPAAERAALAPRGGMIRESGETGARAEDGPGEADGGFSGPLSPEQAVGPGGRISDRAREAIMSSIRKKHLSLASALDKVASWRLEGDSLVLTCSNGYTSANIERARQKIQESVSAVLGRPYRIAVEKGGTDGAAEKGEGPDDNIELIRRVFKGEIVEDS